MKRKTKQKNQQNISFISSLIWNLIIPETFILINNKENSVINQMREKKVKTKTKERIAINHVFPFISFVLQNVFIWS